ncbi:glycoside hydrolase family 36 protein [Leifsonia sp. NPDC014704]|uniref:glycoside hydrolase family 36 protein n=1 Tax=Leifsonia sp. NPDC014704 TaxID=3364123 RepID=UPI0036F47951
MGDRLRVVEHRILEHDGHQELVVAQADPVTGLTAQTIIRRPNNTAAYSFQTTVINDSKSAVTITALSSLTLGFAQDEEELDHVSVSSARSEWLAENRWEQTPVRAHLPRLNLAFHGQDGRGHYGVTSHGAWSSGEHLPAGILQRTDGAALAWQVETSGPWHWELSQARDGGVLTALGATDLEHHFAVTLQPTETFTGVPATVAVSAGGRDGAIAELTRYRRWLRERSDGLDGLPVVYNDFMNTLMGQPSTEALMPLIQSAAEAGVECFCIDAGWYADPAIGDWWATVGEWRESPQRFTNGMREVIDAIHAHGMRSGIWLEPEVVGVNSPIAERLPEEAFFHRFGQRVVEHERYQLDFRHPAAREHLDRTVDELVGSYGISYFKLDYNINPGAGTEQDASGAGAGLLAHTRALTDWIAGIRARHPYVSIENCSSGAMRADYNLLAVTQLQSTTDQQDFRLYPPVAASAPATIVPEQCGNWAYPAVEMSAEEVQFTLITGLSGRLYLSGFLHDLEITARALVARAVAVHKAWRPWLSRSEPFWPLGFPAWDDESVCLGLTDGTVTRVFVWDRAENSREIVLPGVARGRKASVVSLASTEEQWAVRAEGEDLVVNTVPGFTARVIELR